MSYQHLVDTEFNRVTFRYSQEGVAGGAPGREGRLWRLCDT